MLLALFDMDGTIIDSQAHIVGSMGLAVEGMGLTPPKRNATLSIVGLSLPQAMFKLVPELDVETRDELVERYKQGFMTLRSKGHASPLYDGALDCIQELHGRDDIVLGIATGKSRRGLDVVFDQNDLAQYFVTTQVCDDHPSKPHPSMVQMALLESGADAAVMIGDTTYDMQMGRAAGAKTLGVTWGYHTPEMLTPYADVLCNEYPQVIPAIEDLKTI
ncbi:MAG: HAD-IA family hydrolase [Planktomarina sp.]